MTIGFDASIAGQGAIPPVLYTFVEPALGAESDRPPSVCNVPNCGQLGKHVQVREFACSA